MRKLIVCSALLVMVASATCAANLGRVICVYSAELAASKATTGSLTTIPSRTDLVETDLNTGKRSVLASEVRYSDHSLFVSPDGRYLAMPNEMTLDDDGWKPKGLMLWDRKTGRLSNIHPGYHSGTPIWSRSGRYLAIPDTYSETLSVYDTSTCRLRSLAQYDKLISLTWSAKGDELIVVMPAKKRCAVYSQPIAGKQRVLFKRPYGIDPIAASGDGSGFVFYDADVWSYGRKGAVKVSIRPARDNPWEIVFAPQPDRSRMAALASYNWGEPHLNYDHALYVFQSGVGTAKRIAKWGPDGDSAEQLAGWLKDGSAVVVREQVEWGSDGPADYRRDRWMFRTFDIPNGRSGKLIFDSGPGCLAAVWWPG